jgi:hypothetical protein
MHCARIFMSNQLSKSIVHQYHHIQNYHTFRTYKFTSISSSLLVRLSYVYLVCLRLRLARYYNWGRRRRAYTYSMTHPWRRDG